MLLGASLGFCPANILKKRKTFRPDGLCPSLLKLNGKVSPPELTKIGINLGKGRGSQGLVWIGDCFDLQGLQVLMSELRLLVCKHCIPSARGHYLSPTTQYWWKVNAWEPNQFPSQSWLYWPNFQFATNLRKLGTYSVDSRLLSSWSESDVTNKRTPIYFT